MFSLRFNLKKKEYLFFTDAVYFKFYVKSPRYPIITLIISNV